MSTLLIKGGRVVDPKNGIDAIRDVFVKSGKVAAVGENLSEKADKTIDANGLLGGARRRHHLGRYDAQYQSSCRQSERDRIHFEACTGARPRTHLPKRLHHQG